MGIKSKLMCQLYIAVSLPKITYGIDIWYYPPNKQEGHTRNSGSVMFLRNLQKIQCIAVLTITGTLRSSPDNYIDIHANILLLELALSKACHNAIIWYLTLPETNPIHKLIQNLLNNPPPNKYSSLLYKVLKLYQLTNSQVETIKPLPHLQNQRIHLTTIIDNSRKNSIKSEATDNANYRIYSDSSCINNGIGTAAIIYNKNRITPFKSLKAYLGSPEHHNTYKAKIIGTILTIWILENSAITIRKKISLYIDNQSVIQVLRTPNTLSGQYLIQALLSAANNMARNLTICWISSHSDVHGNKNVNCLAKQAAEGHSSVQSTSHPY